MCKYKMDPTSIVEDREDTILSTDGRTEAQGETSIPPFNVIEARGIKSEGTH